MEVSHRGRVVLARAQVAGDAMKRNLTQLGPLVLPLSEQALYL